MNIQQKTINTLRLLPADMVQQANSGHPGAPMGMAPMAYALWMNALRFDPRQPAWHNRDRFVLSNGHASALLYSLLHLCGVEEASMAQLKNFRQYGSLTPGHPEFGLLPGVDTTTGPLGQGLANAVGFAMAETMLAARFNRPGFPLVDHKTYVFAGDGCMMEGIASEAASLAGTLQLSKLVVLYDDNQISIEGDTDLAFQEDVPARFVAYGWDVIHVADGNDHAQVLAALEAAQDATKPTLIVCPTVIGFGSSKKQGKASAHGEPLGQEELEATRAALGLVGPAFHIDEDVYAHVAQMMEKNTKARKDWEAMLLAYEKEHPELFAQWLAFHGPVDEEVLGAALMQKEKAEASRQSSGEVLAKLAELLPNLVGGSADLAPSNKSYMPGMGDYSAQNRLGRNLRFGVREHAMAAICNGIALHGGLRVYCATFFVFSDYMKGAMRLSAIMNLPVTYILTHDSIGVGEDGETHQPIEHLAALRATPGIRVIRPCDYNETAQAWISALLSPGPSCLVLSRQNLRQFTQSKAGSQQGGYVLRPAQKETPDLLLMGSGSEMGILAEAQDVLLQEGIDAALISMPCMEDFLEQDQAYQDRVLPPSNRRRLAVEAGATQPWYRFVGLDGQVLGLDHFGASAPAEVLFGAYGFTAGHVADLAREVYKKK